MEKIEYGSLGDCLLAILQADLSPMEYLVFTGVHIGGISEADLADQLNDTFDLDLSRSKVHRLKRQATASIRKAVAK